MRGGKIVTSAVGSHATQNIFHKPTGRHRSGGTGFSDADNREFAGKPQTVWFRVTEVHLDDRIQGSSSGGAAL
jgi:hypothetical protein